MPWLSGQNTAEEAVKPVIDSTVPNPKLSVSSTVTFIPAQIDGFCVTLPVHCNQAPSQLFLGDLQLFAQNISCLPGMVLATCTAKVLGGLFSNPTDSRDTILQFFLAATQIWMLVIAPLTILVLPGSLLIICAVAFWLVTMAMAWPLSSPTIVMGKREKAPVTEDFGDERWIYVNGIMCSNRLLQAQCNRLSTIFGRPVTGIHNRTYGLILDLISVLLQRCLNIRTSCTLTLASQIRDACLTNSVRKVILIGHSTGSLHISIALDQLHYNLPVDVLSKIEIYTFGSAASHFSNPRLKTDNSHGTTGASDRINYTRPDGSVASPVKATLASLGHRIEDHERVIPHVEHYALESDIFARCGVLHSTRNTLDNRFCGRVFIFNDKQINTAKKIPFLALSGGGFLMNEHYLDLLFPSSKAHVGDTLNRVVEVDIETAEKREFTAQGIALPQKSIAKGNDLVKLNGDESSGFSPTAGAKKRASWEMAAAIGIGGVSKARIAAKECEGKTVKQLSRLWRYVNGGRPVGEGVAVINGVGKKNLSGTGLGMVQ